MRACFPLGCGCQSTLLAHIRADLTVQPAAEIEEVVWITPSDTSLPLAPLTRDHLLPITRQRLAPR